MSLVSVIIPSRNCDYLAKTVEDLFTKARGDIEVIALLDGFWPSPIPADHPRLTIVHKGSVGGMRDSINRGVAIAHGKYIMKTDDHCMFSEGFDLALQKDIGDDCLSVPSRYSLDIKKWERKDRPPVQYNFLTWPYVSDDQFGLGFHGKKWMGATRGPQGYYEPEIRLKDRPIDEVITFQGSCWFMSKQKFLDIDGLDTKYSYLMFQEAQELGFKVWLSGGKVIVNKRVWYAHWHKTDPSQNNYHLSAQAKKDTERLSTWFWMNNKWPKQTRDIKWLIDKFFPLPGWPQNWEEEKKRYESKDPEMWQSFRIFDEKGHDGLRWQNN